MTEGYAEYSPYEKMLEVFERMQTSSVKPDMMTFVGHLSHVPTSAVRVLESATDMRWLSTQVYTHLPSTGEKIKKLVLV
jgi:pentatricopeptide repeat protein